MTPRLGMRQMAGDNGTLFCWRVRDGALDLVRFRTNVEDPTRCGEPPFPSALRTLVVRRPPLPPPAPFDNLMPPPPAFPAVCSGIPHVSGFGLGAAIPHF